MEPPKRKSLTEPSKKLFMPAAILLDWDHTLINPDETIRRAIDATIVKMAEEGHTPHDAELTGAAVLANPQARTEIIGYLQEQFRVAGNDEQVKELYKTMYAEQSAALGNDRAKIIAGAGLVLRYLQKNDIPWAIVSNKPSTTLASEFATYFGSICQDPLLVGSDMANAKPKPDMLIKAMDLLHVPEADRHNVWMVGDGLSTDIAAANAAGCTSVWYGHDAAMAKHAPPETVQHCVANHKELLMLLGKTRQHEAAR